MGKPRSKNDGRGRMGGRQPGTPNKVKAPMRELLVNFSEATFDEFVTAFHEIDEPKEKCKIWLDVQSYCTPKLSSVELKDKLAKKTYQDELDELSKEE